MELLQDLFEKRVSQFISDKRSHKVFFPKAEKKRDTMAKRSAEIVKIKAAGKIIDTMNDEDFEHVKYHAHYQYLIKHKGILYLEEEIEERIAKFYQGALVMDEEVNPVVEEQSVPNNSTREFDDKEGERPGFQYDRRKAVQYAERWWNDYNPAYKKFEVDCTNFISQCLHAGEAPMRGYPNRGSGWWQQQNNWSYSWAVANSLRLYLTNSTRGLQAKEVSSPEELLLGDVICYDFEGDGRYNHNTIVTGKDADGMPLVNAHTYNSRMRYWAYEDSTAYTPNIKYRFFSIQGS